MRANAEAMMKSECRIGAISGWLHSVDSVRFSAFSASSAIQKANAAQQRRTQKRFAQYVTSV
jgi:hypothetical protein